MRKDFIILDWLEGNVSSDELSFYLKHYDKLVPFENIDQVFHSQKQSSHSQSPNSCSHSEQDSK